MRTFATDALKTRRSIRSFGPEIPDKNVIQEIIDCARLAPTARNVQPWEFVVVLNKETLEKVANLTDNGKFIAQSACCIAVFCEDTKYYLEDGSSATVNILNAAWFLGWGSCWVAGDKKPYCEDIRKLLGLPEGYKLVSLIALGKAVAAQVLPLKRPLSTVLHWEHFNTST